MLLQLIVGVALLCASTIARADNGLSTVKLEEALKNAKTAKKAVLIEFARSGALLVASSRARPQELEG